MASIVKRKNRYSVVYTYKDDDGNQHQKWETFDTNADAKKRKTQIEFEQQSGTFIIPNATTVADLLEEYCSVYGVNNWAMSTYRSKKGLMYNYIIPLIGDVKLDELTPRLMDKFYQSLLKVKTKSVQNKKPKNEYLTVHTVREIHKFLRSAFNQAVKWELMTRNPVLNATLPKEEHQKREIWTAETLMHALEVCDDDILALAINLSFACSLRMGEMLGLTWDCIDISEESLKENNASIFVDKELQRVNRDVMEVLDNKDIIRVFPRTLSNTQTSLVLKTPKTKTSVRKIFLPSTVAQMLLERKKQIDEMKELFGDEYLDYNLVFCHSSGRPMEGQVINRALKKLIQDTPEWIWLPMFTAISLTRTGDTMHRSLRNSSTMQKDSKMWRKEKLLQCPSLKLRLNFLTQWQRFKKRAKLKKKSLLRTVQMKTLPCSQNCYQIRKQQHY